MIQKDRLAQKHELFTKLGALFVGVTKVYKNPGEFSEQEKARAIAQYCSGYPFVIKEFGEFAKGELYHNYTVQEQKFNIALNSLVQILVTHDELTNDNIHYCLSQAMNAIDAVPTPNSSIILESGTPFSTYCKLKSLCEVDATNSLVLIDPYMNSTIFHRYLSGVRSNVSITLLTCKQRDWESFLDISKLFAKERYQYSLLVYDKTNQTKRLHDRWIVFDKKRIYSLGGSAKDAGDKSYYTITSIEPSDTNLQAIDAQLADGSPV